jgi:hypothetical protein
MMSSRETLALLRVERMARKVIRYPDDRAPKHALARALRNLDKVRAEVEA